MLYILTSFQGLNTPKSFTKLLLNIFCSKSDKWKKKQTKWCKIFQKNYFFILYQNAGQLFNLDSTEKTIKPQIIFEATQMSSIQIYKLFVSLLWDPTLFTCFYYAFLYTYLDLGHAYITIINKTIPCCPSTLSTNCDLKTRSNIHILDCCSNT